MKYPLKGSIWKLLHIQDGLQLGYELLQSGGVGRENCRISRNGRKVRAQVI